MQKEHGERCGVCGWYLIEHMFNVHCAAANAANDQLEAEVRDAMREPLDPEELERSLEVARETLAFVRFKQDLKRN